MTAPAANPPRRVRMAHVEWVSERMNERDYAILETVNRLRLVSSQQIERLFFSSLSTVGSRNAARGRALRRLVAWRVLAPLPRRVGGVGHGSAVLVLALDSAGRRVLAARQAGSNGEPPIRATALPGERTVRHTLAVAGLYTDLAGQTGGASARLTTLVHETPGAYDPWLVPDPSGKALPSSEEVFHPCIGRKSGAEHARHQPNQEADPYR